MKITKEIAINNLNGLKLAIPAMSEVVDFAVAALQESMWTRVEDQLPAAGQNVIVSFVEMENGEVYNARVTMAYYDDYKNMWSNMGSAIVTAWKPLPTPADDIAMKD